MIGSLCGSARLRVYYRAGLAMRFLLTYVGARAFASMPPHCCPRARRLHDAIIVLAITAAFFDVGIFRTYIVYVCVCATARVGVGK